MMTFSKLGKTWILDVDGTVVKHNGYKIDGYDTLLDGVKEFFLRISPEDTVILLTAREEKYLDDLKRFLAVNNIRYDHLLTGMPVGERILINDRKPSGLDMAFAVNKNRDEALAVDFELSGEL